MQVQVVEPMSEHSACRLCAKPTAVQVTSPDQQVEFPATVHGIDAGQADEPDRIRCPFEQDRAPHVDAAPPQVLVEPRVIDLFGDVTSRRAEAIYQIAVLPPAIDHGDVIASELTKGHHRTISASTSTSLAKSSGAYR
jgi:hypothetical protein